jgi:hypothetical protein
MTSEFNAGAGEVPEYPIRSAFQIFYPSYAGKHAVSAGQAKAAACISACKTGTLGYSVSECPECGFKRIRSCSCNNRDCPCCQAPLEKKWVMERNSELISGIAYYHVVFTIPHELNPLVFANQKLLYGLLFSAASGSLVTLCRDRKYMGATPGIVSVLHTWGQKLNFHPHLHVCLSGGGLTPDGRFVESRRKGFLFPKPVLGKLFRGRFLSGLKALHDSGRLSFAGDAGPLRNSFRWKEFLDGLYAADWIPFLKETFNGNGNAVEYLARYAYRTAISNSRVLDVDAQQVSLSYTDYADGNEKKLLVLPGEEFIRRFLMHVLPKGFHRVRFSGFLANCRKTALLTHIGKLRRTPYAGNPVRGKRIPQILTLLYGSDICSCPCCRAKMITYRCQHPPEI